MSEPKQPSDFPFISVEDQISLEIGTIGNRPGEVEFVLQTVPAITWWKGLEVRARSGALLGSLQTQDADHGPHSVFVPADELVGASLTLGKAKLLGIHTGMYELGNLSAFRGRRLFFLWQRDDHRDGPVAGFFRDLGNGIATAANGVATVVETVIGFIAELAGTVIEAVGTALADALNWFGNLLRGIPGIGAVLQGFFHWVATIISAVFDFVATVVKGILDLVANLAAGVIRIVGGAIGGLLAWDGRLAAKGVGDALAGIAGAVVAIVGKLLAVIQAVLFMQFGERSLTADEAALLQRVYRGSIALYNVRIVEGFAGLFSVNNRAFTLGNKIYMKNTPASAYAAVLVHEGCHVWQNQHQGTRYLADALWAQATSGYSWRAELSRGHFRWQDFNKEAQGQFFQDLWDFGRRVPAPSAGRPGEFFDEDPVGFNMQFRDERTDGGDFTDLARETVAYVRNASWPLPR